MNELDQLLQRMIDLGASDMHLNHMNKITYRIDGIINQIGPIITGDQIFEISLYALHSEQQRQFLDTGSVDFSYQYNGTRFRGSLIHQKGEPSCVYRKVNSEIVPIDELGLPPILKKLADSSWGLILFTGPTGSGKTTSLASIIDYINENKAIHIATVEQPIEYVHVNKQAIVTQREVPSDTPSFADSMRDILRQDPDVILVGEMRDLETISAAITNAETGHLVFGTLHTNTAPHSINRIVDVYPVNQHNNIRSQLASNLRAIVAQRLYPKPGGGRTALFEIMIVNDEMRKLIRSGETEKLYDVMKRSRGEGNVLMQDSIKMAKQQGLINQNVEW